MRSGHCGVYLGSRIAPELARSAQEPRWVERIEDNHRMNRRSLFINPVEFPVPGIKDYNFLQYSIHH